MRIGGSNVDGRRINRKGYAFIYMPEHHRSGNNGYVREHLVIVEKAIGNWLPLNAIVHHVDGNPNNNINTNLVVCENNAYHELIHLRTRALRSTGDPGLLRCSKCKQYYSPESFHSNKSKVRKRHNWCKHRCKEDRIKNREKNSIKNAKIWANVLSTETEATRKVRLEKRRITRRKYECKKKEQLCA